MRLTGGGIVVEYLIREGEQYVCGLPGYGDAAIGQSNRIVERFGTTGLPTRLGAEMSFQTT
jgi:hypothetical protein